MNPSTKSSWWHNATTEQRLDIPPDILRAAANRVFEFETAVQSGKFKDDPDGAGAHDFLTLLFARTIMAGYSTGWSAAIRSRGEG